MVVDKGKHIEHVGIRGMKWGVRNNNRASRKAETKSSAFRKFGFNKDADRMAQKAAKYRDKAEKLVKKIAAAKLNKERLAVYKQTEQYKIDKLKVSILLGAVATSLIFLYEKGNE
jgi:hypothetical protein